MDEQNPIGTDQTDPSSGDGSDGQPAASAPAYLTREEFAATMQAAMGQLVDTLSRQFQSQADKRENRLEQRFQARLTQLNEGLAQMQASGMVDEKQAAALKARFSQQALESALQPDPAGAPDPAEQDQAYQEEVQYVTDQGRFFGEELGLAPGDPELRTIVTDRTPEEYFASIVQAGKAKMQRLAAAQQPANLARLAAVGPSGNSAPRNPLANVTDVDALYAQAENGFLQQYRGPQQRPR